MKIIFAFAMSIVIMTCQTAYCFFSDDPDQYHYDCDARVRDIKDCLIFTTHILSVPPEMPTPTPTGSPLPPDNHNQQQDIDHNLILDELNTDCDNNAIVHWGRDCYAGIERKWPIVKNNQCRRDQPWDPYRGMRMQGGGTTFEVFMENGFHSLINS
jgi:hypothetical protein